MPERMYKYAVIAKGMPDTLAEDAQKEVRRLNTRQFQRPYFI